MTAIVTIANQKGGVGKTTTAINLAAAISLREKKTLLIDLDPQSNSTIAFFETADIQTSMFDVLGDHRAELASIIKVSKDPMLSVAPAKLALAKMEQQLAGQFDAPFKLKDALAAIVKDYDYIVIDTPPALGILTVNAMVASTHLLVPIQAAYFAIEGTDVRLEESPAYKETIMTFAPKSPGAKEYGKLALEVIERVEEDRIARHTEDAA